MGNEARAAVAGRAGALNARGVAPCAPGARFRAVRACIFDLDGTLVSGPYDFRAMREQVWEIARDYGWIGVPDMSLPALEAIDWVQRLPVMHGGRATAFARAARAALEQRELDWLPRCHPVEGAAEAVARLMAAGIRCVVITRNSARVARALLAQLAVALPCVARDRVVRVKPDPAHLHAALAQVRCTSRETVMVGDHPMDIAAGRACTMRTIGVLTGSGTVESLQQAGADVVIESVAALPGVLLEAAA